MIETTVTHTRYTCGTTAPTLLARRNSSRVWCLIQNDATTLNFGRVFFGSYAEATAAFAADQNNGVLLQCMFNVTDYYMPVGQVIIDESHPYKGEIYGWGITNAFYANVIEASS